MLEELDFIFSGVAITVWVNWNKIGDSDFSPAQGCHVEVELIQLSAGRPDEAIPSFRFLSAGRFPN